MATAPGFDSQFEKNDVEFFHWVFSVVRDRLVRSFMNSKHNFSEMWVNSMAANLKERFLKSTVFYATITYLLAARYKKRSYEFAAFGETLLNPLRITDVILRRYVISCMFIDVQRRVCKNIERIQRLLFRKMTACGLFIIDAELPLQLLDVISTYTIVLLQFAYL